MQCIHSQMYGSEISLVQTVLMEGSDFNRRDSDIDWEREKTQTVSE